MSRIIRTLLVLTLALLPLAASARSSDLLDPDPIAIPAGMSPEKVAQAIRSALIGRTWTVTRQEPGHIDSTLHIRSHTATIAVTYDDKQIHIAYVSSDNLKYKVKSNGKRTIHSNYNEWIANIVLDLQRQLQSMS